MAYVDQVPGSKRMSTIAGVVAAHALIGYVMMSGLAVEVARSVSKTLTTENIPIEMPPPPDVPPPPPERVSREVPRTVVERPVTVVPLVQVPTVEGPAVVTLDVPPLPSYPSLDPGAAKVAEPAVAPPSGKASGVRVKGNRASWITNDDYPPSALRAAEEGTVGISVRIGTDGRVSSCEVTGSSGSSALDQATCRLYGRNARFVAARDDAGNPVASTYADRVRWQIPRD